MAMSKIPTQIRKGPWWASFILTLLGMGSSLYLTVLHFKILKFGTAGQTLCDVSAYINCNAVLMSRFAEVGTLPLAGMGLLFYIYLAGALIWAKVEPEKSGGTLAVPYLMVVFSLLLSIFLGYVSVAVLGSLCLFCSSLYLINFLLLIILYKVVPMQFKQIPWIKSLSYLILVFAVGGILLHTGHKQFAQEIPQDKLDLYFEAFSKQPVQKIDTTGRPFFGKEDAKIVIVEFSDFECPYCKRAAQTLKPILKQYKDKIKFVFMNYPLDQSCNPAMQRPLHRNACNAAFAAYCASEQGKFWEYHDMAFERQPKFQKASLDNIAEKLNLDITKFEQCFTSEAVKSRINADLEQGKGAGLQGTPTVYVNGRKFAPWMSRKAWAQLIQKMSEAQN